ncbi:MAG: YidC/Oxa1 family membrane protein insertase [Desulfitobacteriaceae bacterium]|nr:YidC/Oxa1 family membrane protein insertase [Desulfitobacteriaceae bacterium]
MLSSIEELMRVLLNWLFVLSSSIGLPYYGVAIILLTIIIKMLLYPLTWKQMKSMRKISDLNPKIKEIQKKYKNQPDKANAAVMEMYKKHNANPMGGCLPLLVQLPIFWALYKTLYNFNIDSSQAYFLWFDLTQKCGVSNDLFILPILAAVTIYLQTKVSSTMVANDPTQKTMLYIMPLIFGYFASTVPAGLSLYWVTMNCVTILQQLYINKKLAKEKIAETA